MYFTSLLFLCLGFFKVTDSTKKLIITYDFTFQKYESDPNSFVSTQAILFVGENNSFFIEKAKYSKDTLIQALRKSNLSAEEKIVKFLSVEKSKFSYFINKSYNDQTLTYNDAVNGTTFSYEENFPEINWQITTDTTRILNYLCQRATGDYAGRQYEVWFSNEIPISDGPYKFTGLPGLILKLKDSEGKFAFVIKGIEIRESLKIPSKRTKNVVTKENLQSRMNHYYTNRLEYNRDRDRDIIVRDGKQITEEEFYEGLKMKYLDWVRIEKE